MEMTEQQVLGELAVAERGDGWLAACASSGRYVGVAAELADALAAVLRELDPVGPILEICAGNGELAGALKRRGCPVVATDVDPPPSTEVVRLDAAAALNRYRPAVVLGCFVPTGAAIDQAVLACPSVRDYVVLNARLGPLCGDQCLWTSRSWYATRLEHVAERLITRHDVWLNSEKVVRHGEAWHFRRTPP
jgi:hypothetical protein